MAASVDLSGLTLNPEEVRNIAEFVIEKTFTREDLNRLHNIQTGIQMQEQIVFASQFGKTGIKGDSTCTRKDSGAQSTLTQKYWNPAGIEDTLQHCNKELNSLWKAYFGKIQRYRENYEIEGSELAELLMMLLIESMDVTIYRAAWFGDLNVAAAGAGSAGLVSAGNIQFYDYFDGIWEQIFDGVTATDIERYTIALNAVTTSKSDQLALTTDLAKDTYFEEVWKLADPRLKSDPNRTMYVTGEIWENYRQSLQSSGENFTIEYTTEGFRELKWNGVPVVNMETIWDLDSREDFVNNTTDNVYYLPNRIVLSTPENLPIGTLSTDDFDELEQWYDRDNRLNKLGYGFSLDSKVLEEYMIVVAY
jgi:hypothetical protein